MRTANPQSILAFIEGSENLKNTLRASFTSSGRPESAAEHSWRLCLLVMACAPHYPGLSVEKMLKMAVLHDLGEAVCGDIPATLQSESDNRMPREREAIEALTRPLPGEMAREFRELWREYAQGSTEEARVVKSLDKLETLIQHNQGRNPPGFDYRFNLIYASACTSGDPFITELRRLIDDETRRKIQP